MDLLEGMDPEYETKVRPRKEGGSIVVTIPQEIVALVGLRPREELPIRVFRTPNGHLIVIEKRVSAVGAEVA